MAKQLLRERFQELAGIKTAGLALREEDDAPQDDASQAGGEDQDQAGGEGEEAVTELIDHLDIKKSLFLKIKTPEAAKKLMGSLLEKLPSNIQSMKSQIFRELTEDEEGSADDQKDNGAEDMNTFTPRKGGRIPGAGFDNSGGFDTSGNTKLFGKK